MLAGNTTKEIWTDECFSKKFIAGLASRKKIRELKISAVVTSSKLIEDFSSRVTSSKLIEDFSSRDVIQAY
ncbi:hypothetical protein F511_03464 [Dorcoceras hygrometricum]|uniref:Uncharacterized protein n=1 Tax=Dorcoceras hygrometricum TaxID=472368 RepID=A0A2Z7AB50_9LAMI|nr:hypothetical protein F511_03464 [Dorcoceras hygrometricum]